MSRLRKAIPVDVQAAQARLDGMLSVDPRLDFGSGVSVETLAAAIKAVTDAISDYNQKLALLDQESNQIDVKKKILNDLTSRALKGAELRFGKNSDEYEMVGGTKTSDRKKPERKNGGGAVK
ncbi:MAG: hypothetical protein JSS81_22710 [Acidobacteria bacterium]|nr:hypothetical protein [Acidobacteriota bacterium]